MTTPRYTFHVSGSGSYFNIVRKHVGDGSRAIVLANDITSHMIANELARLLTATYGMGLANGVGEDHDEESSGVEGCK